MKKILDILKILIDIRRDVSSLNLLRKKILECLLNLEDVKFQKNINPFLENILITGLSNNDRIIVEREKQKEISLFLDKFECEDFYISCNLYYTMFIAKLFPQISKLLNNIENKLFNCKGKNINKKTRNHIIDFIEDFREKIYFTENKEELIYSINLKPLSISTENYNKYYLINDIMKPDYTSNFFSIEKEIDFLNLKNIENSELMCYPYYSDNIKCMYTMILSILKVNLENNLPTCSPYKILRNINNINYFECVNYEMAMKIYNFRPLINFNYEKFDSLDEAVAFNIYLNTKNIKGLMFNYLNKYHISYENQKVKIPEDLQINYYKQRIKDKYNINEDYSLYKLVNAYEHKGVLIFEDEDIKINPVTGDYIPLDLILNKGLSMYNLEKHHMGLLSGFTDRKIMFDRKEIKIDKIIDFCIVENIEYLYTITLNYEGEDILIARDFYLEDAEEIFLNCLEKFWKKGYLLTDYGIEKYITFGNFDKKDIKLPEWFISKNNQDFMWLKSVIKNI